MKYKFLTALFTGTILATKAFAGITTSGTPEHGINGWIGLDTYTPLPAYDVFTPGTISEGPSYNDNNVVLDIGEGTTYYSDMDIAGAYSMDEDNIHNVTNNTLTLKSGNFENIFFYGAYTEKGDAIGNSVILNGEGSGAINGAWTWGGSANNNKIIINGGSYKGSIRVVGVGIDNYTPSVIPGNEEEMIQVMGNYFANAANNNEAVISGNANLEEADIVGIIVGGAELSIPRFGGNNILRIDATDKNWNGKIGTISAFSDIVFEKINWNTSTPVITTELLTVGNNVPLIVENIKSHYGESYANNIGGFYNFFADERTKIDVKNVSVAGGTELSSGDEMTLIHVENGIRDVTKPGFEGGFTYDTKGKIANDGDTIVPIYEGVATVHSATINQVDNENGSSDIKLIIGDEVAQMNSQVLVIGESRVAATAFANQGNELIETGIDAIIRDTKKGGKLQSFGAIYTNNSKFATGSHVKVEGWSGIIGVGKTNAEGLSLGAFFEGGDGSYKTYNSFDGEHMRGEGNATYVGGGVLARKEFDKGIYAETSLRIGNLQNELDNAVKGSEGMTGYDVDTFYFGGHLGLGKIIDLCKAGNSIDVYGKLLYTHHDGEKFKIDGDNFKFDSIDSTRSRLGFRFNHAHSGKFSMYYGAAWEYEFDGDANNKVADYDLGTPSLSGSTAIGEIGAHYQTDTNWNFDFNVRGYIGQRDGLSGSLQAIYSF